MRYEEAETATKSSEGARVEKGTATGRAWEMRWFTLWKPRVFRRAPL